MSITKYSLPLACAYIFTSFVVLANGVPNPVPVTETVIGIPTTKDVDNGYAGLKWALGDNLVPDIVVGFRHANVSTNGDTYGGDVSFSFKVYGGLKPGKIRLKYFNGADYMQGEVGGGYDFTKGFFAGIGLTPPFLTWVSIITLLIASL
ncbi:hypothetical protein [Methylomonas sp. AM2-LC]|uniref:hypothetical protein n=1 Tax=Methylomonas sp. AM2-LC TaxID=3153301 RepID=UPI00326749D7